MPGAAKGVVPKKRHWDRVLDRGCARQRRHGEGEGAERDGGRDQPVRDVRLPEQHVRHRHHGEGHDEEADATVGEQRTGQHHRQHRALPPQPLGDEAGGGQRRAGVIHHLAEHGAEQKDREELREEARRPTHKGLRPVGEQRLPCERGGQQRRRGRHQQHAPAPVGQPDEQPETEQDAEQAHSLSPPAWVPRAACAPGPGRGRSSLLLAGSVSLAKDLLYRAG